MMFSGLWSTPRLAHARWITSDMGRARFQSDECVASGSRLCIKRALAKKEMIELFSSKRNQIPSRSTAFAANYSPPCPFPQASIMAESDSIWMYNPSLALAIIGAIVFGIIFTITSYQTLIKYRAWYFVVVPIGATVELVAYIFRTYSVKNLSALVRLPLSPCPPSRD